MRHAARQPADRVEPLRVDQGLLQPALLRLIAVCCDDVGQPPLAVKQRVEAGGGDSFAATYAQERLAVLDGDAEAQLAWAYWSPVDAAGRPPAEVRAPDATARCRADRLLEARTPFIDALRSSGLDFRARGTV